MAARVKKVDFSRRGKWLKLLFIAFLIYFTVIIINQQSTLNNLKERNQEIKAEINDLEGVNLELKNQIDLLQNNPDYIEGIARRELGLVREGETVYIFPQLNLGK